MSESHVMWAISEPILVFLGLSVLESSQTYATDTQTSDNTKASLNASTLWGRTVGGRITLTKVAMLCNDVLYLFKHRTSLYHWSVTQ